MNENIQKVERIQLICPKCKHEFQYNFGKEEEELRNKGIEINQLNKWLADFNKLPLDVKLQPRNRAERARKISLLQQKKLEQSKLKAKHKLVRDVMEKENFDILKGIIKEFYGQKEFERCMNEMIERGKAYSIKNTMGIDYYSSSDGKHIKKL